LSSIQQIHKATTNDASSELITTPLLVNSVDQKQAAKAYLLRDFLRAESPSKM